MNDYEDYEEDYDPEEAQRRIDKAERERRRNQSGTYWEDRTAADEWDTPGGPYD